MVNCTNNHLEEDEDGNEYNSYGVGKKKSELKGNTPRSKHSETEQRRRSKINQRFQALRDLIPQNDQKRDKASLLLEAIEYIQFLHEKLQMYEGSYQGWSREPTKLIPWRSHNVPAERSMDHSQVIKGGSCLEILSTEMLTNAQNSVESDSGTEATYKDFASDVEYMVSQAQLLQYRVIEQELTTESKCVAPSNTLNEPEEIESASSAYSQGILDSLIQAMQSSGVDLSKASISVQLDVSKQSSSLLIATASSSKDDMNPSPSNRGVEKVDEDSGQAHKRLRIERS